MYPDLETNHEFVLKAQADKLQLLYRQSFPAVLVSVITAVILSTILWTHVEQTLLFTWLGCVLLSSAFRLALFISYYRTSPDSVSVLAWEKPYVITLMISSIVWGIGCTWIIATVPASFQPIIYFFLIGMAGGAISVYSASRFMVLSTVIIVLLPSTIWLLLQNEMLPVLMGLGGTLFLVSSIRATKVLSSALHQSFLLTHQLTEAKEAAEALAKIDILTGLNNRGSFTDLSEAQNRYCQRYKLPVSVILLDLDKFKNINDTRGHFAGDLALQHLAKLLLLSTRDSDICGRVGGEEFAILLPNTEAADAKKTAEKIRSSVANQPIKSPDGDFNITASFGIATGNQGIEQLIKNADAAMYQAKEAGRNQVHHYDD